MELVISCNVRDKTVEVIRYIKREKRVDKV